MRPQVVAEVVGCESCLGRWARMMLRCCFWCQDVTVKPKNRTAVVKWKWYVLKSNIYHSPALITVSPSLSGTHGLFLLTMLACLCPKVSVTATHPIFPQSVTVVNSDGRSCSQNWQQWRVGLSLPTDSILDARKRFGISKRIVCQTC